MNLRLSILATGFVLLTLSLSFADTESIKENLKLNPLTSIQKYSAGQNLDSNSNSVKKSGEYIQNMGKKLFEISNTLKQPTNKSSKSETLKSYNDSSSSIYKQYNEELQTVCRQNGTPIQIKVVSNRSEEQGYKKNQTAEDSARAFLNRYSRVIKINNPDEEMKVLKNFTGELGHNHVRFKQYFQGLPVWPSELTVHLDENHNVSTLNGNFMPTPTKPIPSTPRISAEQARSAGLNVLSNSVQLDCIEQELIYYPATNGMLNLAWKMLFTGTLTESWIVVIDAVTGNTLTNFSLIMHNNVMGQSTDLIGNTITIPLWEVGGTYYVLNTTKPMFNPQTLPGGTLPQPDNLNGGILILDLANQEPDQANIIDFVTSPSSNGGILPDAVSAAQNLALTYDYYYQIHQRNSIDAQGGNVIGIVRASTNMANAFWTGQAMFFGDGEPFSAALDVVAHELTHGVTQYTANLTYQNQSGALNEAMSDIFGEMIEKYAQGSNDWLAGSIFPQPLRNMKNPSAFSSPFGPYPAHMDQYYRITEDNGGVHINSSIINRCFYLLAEGLDGAIGTEDAAKIFYRALSTHLVANSQFADARVAVIASAEELFGADSIQKQKAEEAFTTVGIGIGATTQPPPSIPAVQGNDATIFICPDPYLKAYYMCRMDPAQGDTGSGVYLSNTPVRQTRFSVTKDGSIAMFVSSDNDICLIRTDGAAEECIGYTGTIHAATMSPDGNMFAVILLDQNKSGEPANEINLLTEQGAISYTLKSPSLDAESINTILFADVINFTLDGRFLIYDALNILQLANGPQSTDWSIYSLELESGNSVPIIPPVSGLDIGNPGLSQTSDNFIVFTAGNAYDQIYGIFTGNINTGEIKQAGVTYALGLGSYTGDDTAIIYDIPDPNSFTLFSLVKQSVDVDKITITGDPAIWVTGGIYGTIYRQGTFQGEIKSNGFFDLRTNILRLNAVDVSTDQGLVTVQADLLMLSDSTLTFTLTGAEFINDGSTGTNPYFDPTTATIDLPVIYITDQNSNTSRFHILLQLIPDNSEILFRIIDAQAI